MTVNSTQITSGPYPGNDIADTFDYDFRIEDKTQLIVYETDDQGAGGDTPLTVDTDYTVAGIGVDGGGTVTRVAGALPTGYSWYIRSDYEQTQLTAFASQGGFLPEVHEAAMDKLTFLVQQIEDILGRSIRLSESYDGGVITTLPDPVAEKFLRWKADLSGMENVTLGTASLTLPIYQLSDYDNIADAIGDIGSANAELWIDKSDTDINSPVTSPVNITLRFVTGFILDGTSTLTMNGSVKAGYYQIFGSSITVTGLRLASPEWWGAVTGTDETAPIPSNNFIAMTSACNAVSSGGIVELQAGTYKWGGDRVDISNIWIKGQGRDLTIVDLVDDGEISSIPTTSKFQSTDGNVTISDIHFYNDDFIIANDVMIIWTAASNITIKDCKFTCGNRPFRFGHATAENIYVLNNILVNTSTLANGGTPTIDIEDGATNVHVIGNYVEAATCTQANGNQFLSINLQVKDSFVTRNIVGGSYTGGILLETSDNENVHVSENIIDLTNSAEAVAYGVYCQGITSAYIYNNTIIGRNVDDGINVQPSTTVHTLIEIHNNKIFDVNRGIDWLISAGTHSGSPIIYNNVFTDVKSVYRIIAATGVVAESGKLIFDNNYATLAVNNSYRSMYINVRPEAGWMSIQNNIIIPHPSSTLTWAMEIFSVPPAIIGGNSVPDDDVRIHGPYLRNMSTAVFSSIKWTGLQRSQITAIDLSGSAYRNLFPQVQSGRLVRSVSFVYTEASSADAGVSIILRHYNPTTTATGNTIETYTSEINKNYGYTKTIYLPDLDSPDKADSQSTGYPFWEVYCAGGKSGSGEVVVVIEWIDNDVVY